MERLYLKTAPQGQKTTDDIYKGIDPDNIFCVSIMPCPGGCVCGGGQSIDFLDERTSARTETLYNLDNESHTRFSHENLSIKKLYEEFLIAPLSDKSHDLLHIMHKTSEPIVHTNAKERLT